jgi:hypothetical protein
MNATRANSAADTTNIAQAVQNVANAATTKQSTPISTVPARVVTAIDGEPYSLEVNGQVFTRPRDPVEARRQVRLDEIGEQIEALAGEHRDEVSKLLGQFEELWSGRTNDVHDYVLRQVGFALTDNRLGALWRCIYSRLSADDDKYNPDAAERFLHIPEGEGTNYFGRGSGWTGG